MKKVILPLVIFISFVFLISCNTDDTYQPHVHEWDEGKIWEDSTFLKRGSRVYRCRTCSDKKIETIEYKELDGYWKSEEAEYRGSGGKIMYEMFYFSFDNSEGAFDDLWGRRREQDEFKDGRKRQNFSYHWILDEEGNRAGHLIVDPSSDEETIYDFEVREETGDGNIKVILETAEKEKRIYQSKASRTLKLTKVSYQPHNHSGNVKQIEGDEGKLYHLRDTGCLPEFHEVQMQGLVEEHCYEGEECCCGKEKLHVVEIYRKGDTAPLTTVEVTLKAGYSLSDSIKVGSKTYNVQHWETATGSPLNMNTTYHPEGKNDSLYFTERT